MDFTAAVTSAYITRSLGVARHDWFKPRTEKTPEEQPVLVRQQQTLFYTRFIGGHGWPWVPQLEDFLHNDWFVVATGMSWLYTLQNKQHYNGDFLQ